MSFCVGSIKTDGLLFINVFEGRVPEKEGKTERQTSSLHWFIPQMSAIVEAGLS